MFIRDFFWHELRELHDFICFLLLQKSCNSQFVPNDFSGFNWDEIVIVREDAKTRRATHGGENFVSSRLCVQKINLVRF